VQVATVQARLRGGDPRREEVEVQAPRGRVDRDHALAVVQGGDLELVAGPASVPGGDRRAPPVRCPLVAAVELQLELEVPARVRLDDVVDGGVPRLEGGSEVGEVDPDPEARRRLAG
jgi:hypothetical protein